MRLVLKCSMGWILLPLIFLYSCKRDEAKSPQTDVSDWIKLGPGGGGASFLHFPIKQKTNFLCDAT